MNIQTENDMMTEENLDTIVSIQTKTYMTNADIRLITDEKTDTEKNTEQNQKETVTDKIIKTNRRDSQTYRDRYYYRSDRRTYSTT